MQVTHETLDALLFTLQQNFYTCVAAVAHITRQPVLHCYAVNERTETDALNDACNVNFNSQV